MSWRTGPISSRSRADPVAEEPTPDLPAADVPLSYAAHIKPPFRARNRDSMRFAFDLWSYVDVAAHGEAILERINAGTMPCDGAWPAERVDVLARWIASSMPA